MADSKVSALTAATSCAATDIFYLTVDPGGTPASRKIAVDNIFKRGTLTTDVKVVDASVTWNESGTTFTGFKLNVTDTASAAGSNLLDLQVGSVSKVAVTKAGQIWIKNDTGDWSAGLPELRFIPQSGNEMGLGIASSGSTIHVKQNGVCRMVLRHYSVDFSSIGGFQWTNATNPTTTVDAGIWRDAAGTIGQRYGTNAQTFRVYNTGDSSNGEWGFLRWSSNVFEIGSTAAGTGTVRATSITSTVIKMPNLPTSNPSVAGQLWNNSGVLSVSAG